MVKAGFIGLGNQGGPIARRMINAGYEVALWARRPQTLGLRRTDSGDGSGRAYRNPLHRSYGRQPCTRAWRQVAGKGRALVG
ncbi:MAG: hypothetical protein HPY82_17490 [Gammaproteobacteria bacterium]|nr:hypothetical protein [Gammaproteobacteria bacterium]